MLAGGPSHAIDCRYCDFQHFPIEILQGGCGTSPFWCIEFEEEATKVREEVDSESSVEVGPGIYSIVAVPEHEAEVEDVGAEVRKGKCLVKALSNPGGAEDTEKEKQEEKYNTGILLSRE